MTQQSKSKKAAKAETPEEPAIQPMTMTCRQAALRHPGIEEREFARLCLRGKALSRRYGGPSRVPAKDLHRVLFGRKVGRQWVIPIAELDRVFLGKQDS